MKLRPVLSILLLLVVVAIGAAYIVPSLRKSAAPPQPGKTPVLDETSMRLYGLVEPLGREVFIGPWQARRVTAIAVKEGDRVDAGQPLCTLDADLEVQALRVAESQLEAARRRLDVTLDELQRVKAVSTRGAASEIELRQIELRTKVDEQQVATAQEEIELRRIEIEKLTLRSPIAGLMYKLDVRVGEQLTPADYARIVVGPAERQVRIFVETFWLGRVNVGNRFVVREVETLREIGAGSIEAVSPYVGARDFRTEDRLERLDTKFAQAILRFDGPVSAPIGMQVLCERQVDPG